MNQRAMAELSADLILRYYDNEYLPFLQHMDDDALWYGPAEGQFLRGRETMLRIWNQEAHDLTFTMGNLQTTVISSHPSFCDVMLSYTVVTHYPDGHDLSVLQRLLLTWCERTTKDETGNKVKTHRILVCHIANLHGKSDEDMIYAKNLHPVYHGSKALPHRGDFIHFHGPDQSEYYFLSDTISYIEGDSNKKHCIIHANTGDVTVQTSLRDIEQRWPKLFLRCHQSYLVNPNYVRAIRRFRVTLRGGVELPIPEKKYTDFKARMNALIDRAERS